MRMAYEVMRITSTRSQRRMRDVGSAEELDISVKNVLPNRPKARVKGIKDRVKVKPRKDFLKAEERVNLTTVSVIGVAELAT